MAGTIHFKLLKSHAIEIVNALVFKIPEAKKWFFKSVIMATRSQKGIR